MIETNKLSALAEPEQHITSHELPAQPVIRIEAGKKRAVDISDLWSYRELLYFLTWRDIKVRYKQTLLGAVWVVLQPVLTVLIFTVLFGRLVGVPSDGLPYSIFAYAGLLPWLFFSKAITQSGNSLIGSANLITKVYFPRIIIPTAAVAASLVDLAITLLVLVGLMAYHAIAPGWNLLMLPVMVGLTVILALGAGMWLSALNVKYRDVGALLPFIIQTGFFITPIFYPLSLVPEKWQWLMRLNPLTGIIEGFRSTLLGREFDWGAIAVAATLSLGLLIYAAYAFRRMERSFADVV